MALLLAVAGCVDIDDEVDVDYRDYIATSIATHAMQPDDGPVDPVDGKHAREDCPTDGWITHGDGHRSRCPFCDPPYSGDEQPQQESAESAQDDAVVVPDPQEGSGASSSEDEVPLPFEEPLIEVFPDMPKSFLNLPVPRIWWTYNEGDLRRHNEEDHGISYELQEGLTDRELRQVHSLAHNGRASEVIEALESWNGERSTKIAPPKPTIKYTPKPSSSGYRRRVFGRSR
jgi:hypothetical protein